MHSPLLGPVVALVAWTTLFRIWMAVKHMAAAKRATGGAPPAPEQNAFTSALWEQPTRFYAIVFALMFMGFDAPINVWIAWAYVGFRVAHGLVQGTIDHPRTRFYLFIGATICLVALIVHATLWLMHH